MIVQLGQLLVQAGVMSQDQIEAALLEQARSGEPLGLICERRFSVAPDVIENAWADQYAQLTRTVDPATEYVDFETLELVSRRQAWQFGLIPMRFDGTELVLVTTQANLRRALRFANNILGVPAYFVLADPEALGQALARHYPITGLKADDLGDSAPSRRFIDARR
ncbi:MAG: hypothetical protein AAF432_11850 [Planctomycetota bacterium]